MMSLSNSRSSPSTFHELVQNSVLSGGTKIGRPSNHSFFRACKEEAKDRGNVVGTAIIIHISSPYYLLLKKAEVTMDNDIRLAFGTVVVSHELVSDEVTS